MIKKVLDVKKNEIIILKLGGSVISNKDEPFSLRKKIINNSIKEIAESTKKLILIHGGGSFGHPLAKEYKINEGKNKTIENQLYGLSKTHEAMVQLNSYIINQLLENNVPALSIQPSSIFIRTNGKFHCNLEPVKKCIKADIIPVLYGDIIFSSDNDFSILSGDKVIPLICKKLKGFTIKKVIFGMEKDGIYIYNKGRDKTELASEINCNEVDDLPLADLGKKIDVTGGIRGKLHNIKSICNLNIPVQIINGLKKGNISKALLNENLVCTTIHAQARKETPQISNRKIEHLKIPIKYNVQFRENYLDEIKLVHHAYPECDLKEIDLSIDFFNKKVSAPICISALTGGHPVAKEINKILASAAEKHNIILSVGSQRAGIELKSLEDTFNVVREYAPSVPIIGNIGIGQISASDYNIEDFEKCIDMIKANVMAVHFNALHELVQGEGDTSYKNFQDNFEKIRKKYDIPIIAKEVGNGLNSDSARRLEGLRFDGYDVGGSGGTNFTAIESYRNKDQKVYTRKLTDIFREWGIPTPISIAYVRKVSEKPIIATGGLRTGTDIAKCIALGANIGGFAFKFLKTALKDYEKGGIRNTIKEIETLKNELRSSLWLMNLHNVKELYKNRKKIILFGNIYRWMSQIQ
jgi:isopentenyl-diphosphate delta-isomerase